MRLHEIPSPVPRPGERLVRIRAVGVCGSDAHYYEEGGIGAKIETPMIPGHELAGELLDGPDAGQLVAIDPAENCERCAQCLAGHPNLCPNVRFLGSPGVNGGMCEFLSVPERLLYRVPEPFDAEAASLLEPLGVAVHAVNITKLRPESRVAILGAGPIGLLILQVVLARGAAEVRVIEPLAWRREAALRMGASSAYADFEEAADAAGPEVVFEATNSSFAPDQAARLAAIGGKLTLVGIPEGDRFTLSAGNARRKGLSIRFSRRMSRVLPEAIELVRSGKVQLSPLVTHRFPIEGAQEALHPRSQRAPGVVKACVCL